MDVFDAFHFAYLEDALLVDDVGALSGDETSLSLSHDASGILLLENLRSLTSLACWQVDDAMLESIAACRGLEKLYLTVFRGTSLDAIKDLKNLKILAIDDAPRVSNIDWLSEIGPLSHLKLRDFRRTKDLEALHTQSDLRALSMQGAMWTTWHVSSFEPLSGMCDLEYLDLRNNRAKDGTLKPLSGLRSLRELDICRSYAWEEFARLSGVLRSTACWWFKPFHAIEDDLCESCGATRVMLTGKGQRVVCPTCHRGRYQKHIDKYEAVAKAAQQDNAAAWPEASS